MSSAYAFVYEHCDVPADVTLAEWQRSRSHPRSRRGLGAVLRRLTRHR